MTTIMNNCKTKMMTSYSPCYQSVTVVLEKRLTAQLATFRRKSADFEPDFWGQGSGWLGILVPECSFFGSFS
jgi:hypothetical protein